MTADAKEVPHVIRPARSFPFLELKISQRKIVSIRKENKIWKELVIFSPENNVYRFLEVLEQGKPRTTVMLAVKMVEVEHGLFEEREKVVIKETKLLNLKSGDEDPFGEISALLHLGNTGGHKNVIKIMDYFKSGNMVYLVTPYIEGKDLFAHLKLYGARGLKEDVSMKLFSEIIEALAFLKSQGIVHRDLSAENILVTKDNRIVVIDFGMCLYMPSSKDRRKVLVESQDYRGKVQSEPVMYRKLGSLGD